MPFFSKRDKPNMEGSKKKDMPPGLWEKCPACGEVIHTLELKQNQMVCTKCDHHFFIPSRERLADFLDPESFQETDTDLWPVDVLKFKGPKSYTGSLQKYQAETGLADAVITGTGLLEGRKISVAVMDFRFLGGSMGSVVGEKIARAIERGTKEKLPVIVFSAAGGARMHEGLFALMQMAKTSGALALHAQAGLPYISVLTNPTTGGVTASFATLGDLIVAEPKSMIGFAGPRVVRETTHQNLPEGFQTAEFLHEHGLIDSI
ncbi:MAG TPA: acetyl-CoA carboxylase, carboxyltransferase subunit beta, partial [Chthoniobacteraceae bacterium]|nr:acetyl-CoA carboxylase, carboxyltransferase subunit beta [Chthoniobacteraceae bacterium]